MKVKPERKPSGDPIRIWYDFNAFGIHRLPLTLVGTREDIERHDIELEDGQPVVLYDEAEEIDGSNKEWMLVDAVVSRDNAAGEWVALADWKTFRREPRSD
jgi:hypothetical protein